MDMKDEFSCGLCGKKFSGKKNIAVHKRRCGDTTVRKCEICDKEFVGEMKFQNHKAVHQKKIVSFAIFKFQKIHIQNMKRNATRTLLN